MLAERFASAELVALWSAERKVVLERRLWLAILRAQADLGLPVSGQVIEDYASAVDRVDLASIAARERVSRHDLKARIEEFNALAGHEQVHKGLTSCDVTDNITQLRVRMSLAYLRDRAASLAARLRDASSEPWGQPAPDTDRAPAPGCGQPALARRCAQTAQELRHAAQRLHHLIESYPLRGIKGPVGTAQDMLDLLGGEPRKLLALERRIAAYLGFSRTFDCVGQVYPRSLDYQALCGLLELTAAPGALATVVGSPPGGEQGRPASTEPGMTVRQLLVVLRGYVAMAGELAGEQWNEGDVSCSVVRRVALPGAFFAADGVLTTSLRVLEAHLPARCPAPGRAPTPREPRADA